MPFFTLFDCFLRQRTFFLPPCGMLDVSDDDAKVILDPGFIAYSDINHNREQKPIDGLGKKKKKKKAEPVKIRKKSLG